MRTGKHTQGNVRTAGANDAAGGRADERVLLLADALVVGLGSADRFRGLVDAGEGARGDDGDVLGGGNGHEGGKGDSGVLHFELGLL